MNFFTKSMPLFIFLFGYLCFIVVAQKVEGTITDGKAQMPLPYAGIGWSLHGDGTVSSSDGSFELPFYVGDTLLVSFIGYKTQKIAISIADTSQPLEVFLLPDTVLLDEVLISDLTALELVKKAIEKVPENYAQTPVMHTAFYRSYMKEYYKKGKKRGQTDEILKEVWANIYKQPYEKSERKRQKNEDLIKLVRWRQFGQNLDDDVTQSDTSGQLNGGSINNILNLDEAKSGRLFGGRNIKNYDFEYLPSTTYQGRSVYVVAFDQNDRADELLYEGTLFIDAATTAFVALKYKYSEEGQKMYNDGFSFMFIAADIHSVEAFIEYEFISPKWYLKQLDGHFTVNVTLENTFLFRQLLRADGTKKPKDIFGNDDEVKVKTYNSVQMLLNLKDTSNVQPFAGHEIFRKNSKMSLQDTIPGVLEPAIKLPKFLRKKFEKEIKKQETEKKRQAEAIKEIKEIKEEEVK